MDGKKLTVLAAAFLVTSCGGSGGSDSGSPIGDLECSNNWQKQFVLDAMRDWYFWNDALPSNVNLGQFSSPEALLEYLVSYQSVDRWSYITSAEADSQYFEEGEYEGFGFSSRFVASNDLRLTRVFVLSPAYEAGFERGQRIVALDGRTIADIEANEGVGTVLDNPTVQFLIRNIDGTEFTVSVTQGIVTIDPIPQTRLISTAAGPVGYLEFGAFISTAESSSAELGPGFPDVFAGFSDAAISDLILDLRYNGGGLILTTEVLADYLGGYVADGEVFSKTRYNSNHTDQNRTTSFINRLNSLNLSRLIVVASRGTASASELIINGLSPHVEVTIIGDSTYGKPVGQVAFDFCTKRLRPTAFETVNALDEGGYFDGLPVDCPAADNLNVAVGADNDPNIIAGLAYLANGACPVAAAGQSKPAGQAFAKDLQVTPSSHWVYSRAL